jgi:tetratricopeptide (TPR) repeat protein
LAAVDWSEKGHAKFNRGKHDQAVQDYNRAIELNPNQAVSYYNRARVYSRQERHEQALQDLRKAIQINPDFKNTAKTDHDFDRMRKEPKFINLIGE